MEQAGVGSVEEFPFFFYVAPLTLRSSLRQCGNEMPELFGTTEVKP